MPTVIIPDKICSHCGDNIWYLSNSDGRYRCINRQKDYKKIWTKNNKDKCKQHTKNYKDKVGSSHIYQLNKARHIKWIKEHPEKYREHQRKVYQKHIDTLSDEYLKDLISLNGRSEIKPQDITPELIQLKRKQLLLTRQIKNHESKKENINN